jgi:hypothetical protein
VTLSDALSIADLHQVIQLLMGWDDDHLHRFCIQGFEYGIAHVGGLDFDEDAAAVPLSRFQFQPTERFLYEYDFTAGWQIEIRIEKVTQAGWTPRGAHLLLQTRTRVINGDLDQLIRRRYPAFRLPAVGDSAPTLG